MEDTLLQAIGDVTGYLDTRMEWPHAYRAVESSCSFEINVAGLFSSHEFYELLKINRIEWMSDDDPLWMGTVALK